jgi:hypothetical protein
MAGVIDAVFEVIASLFNKVPWLSKFAGYRSVLGFVGLGVVAFLQAKGIGSADTLSHLWTGFLVFTGLSLNAKGREG